MNKEKTINDMKKIVEDAFLEDYNIGCDPCSDTVAEKLYEIGYRKQTEGKWKIKTDDFDCEYMMCSVCKEEFYPVDEDTVDTTPNYCPNCGAKMKGGE